MEGSFTLGRGLLIARSNTIAQCFGVFANVAVPNGVYVTCVGTDTYPAYDGFVGQFVQDGKEKNNCCFEEVENVVYVKSLREIGKGEELLATKPLTDEELEQLVLQEAKKEQEIQKTREREAAAESEIVEERVEKKKQKTNERRYRVGDVVKAYWKGEDKHYEGKILKKKGKALSIQYEDGDRVDHKEDSFGEDYSGLELIIPKEAFEFSD